MLRDEKLQQASALQHDFLSVPLSNLLWPEKAYCSAMHHKRSTAIHKTFELNFIPFFGGSLRLVYTFSKSTDEPFIVFFNYFLR